jgi:phosphoglycolate phosphatase
LIIDYKAVIFDMDGTLLDTLMDIGDATNLVLKSRGFPQHEIEKYKLFVGRGARKLMEQALPENALEDDLIEDCVNSFLEEYQKTWDQHADLYEGIADLLNELEIQGIRKSILSNKPDFFTKAFASKYLEKWNFEEVVGHSELIPRKPDPKGAFLIAEKMNLTPDQFLYLGDTNIDMQTANTAGMKPVGVLWGFRTREELVSAGAQVLLEKPMDLFDYLRNL